MSQEIEKKESVNSRGKGEFVGEKREIY